VVGHEHVGVDGDLMPRRALAQLREVTVVVGMREEARLAIIPTLDDVLGDAGEVGAGLTRHRERRRRRRVNTRRTRALRGSEISE
jgi:hypothetical protein